MSEAPDQLAPLDALVELRTEKAGGRKDTARRYVGLEHMAQGSPTLLASYPSTYSSGVNGVFERNDILFGKLRPNLRKSLLAPLSGYCSTDILVLRAREHVDSRFAAHVFQWEPVFAAAIATAAGTKMPRTSWNDLRRIRLVRPCPPEEQVRIAAILDLEDAVIETMAAVIVKLKQVRAGLLHDLLTRGLNENGELRDLDQFMDSPVGRIPREWRALPAEAFGEVRLGRQRSPAHEHGRHMRPYLRVANVFDGYIDYSDVLTMNFDPREQAAYGLEPGDILLNEGQSLELVGRSAIYSGLARSYCFQNTLVRFRCNSEAVPQFCQPLFKHALDTRRFMTIAKQTTSVAHLGADRFAKMLFAVPPVPEQLRIARLLHTCDARIMGEEFQVTKLRSLKSGLVADLLSGRVRVPETVEAGVTR